MKKLLSLLAVCIGLTFGAAQAQAQERVYLRWRSVHGYRLYPADRVIEVDDIGVR